LINNSVNQLTWCCPTFWHCEPSKKLFLKTWAASVISKAVTKFYSTLGLSTVLWLKNRTF